MAYKNFAKVYFEHLAANPGGRALRCESAAARLLGLGVQIPRGSMDVCLLWVLCCQVEISTSGWSPEQRSPTECGVSKECDREAPLEEAMTRNGVEAPQGEKMYTLIALILNCCRREYGADNTSHIALHRMKNVILCMGISSDHIEKLLQRKGGGGIYFLPILKVTSPSSVEINPLEPELFFFNFSTPCI